MNKITIALILAATLGNYSQAQEMIFHPEIANWEEAASEAKTIFKIHQKHADARIWKSGDAETKATAVSYSDKNVRLIREDGRPIKIKLSDLSADDKSYLSTQTKILKKWNEFEQKWGWSPDAIVKMEQLKQLELRTERQLKDVQSKKMDLTNEGVEQHQALLRAKTKREETKKLLDKSIAKSKHLIKQMEQLKDDKKELSMKLAKIKNLEGSILKHLTASEKSIWARAHNAPAFSDAPLNSKTNPVVITYAELVDGTIGKELHITYTNKSGKEINALKFGLDTFNDFGESTNDGFAGVSKLQSQNNLKAGETTDCLWRLSFDRSSTSGEVFPTMILFTDGSKWESTEQTKRTKFKNEN